MKKLSLINLCILLLLTSFVNTSYSQPSKGVDQNFKKLQSLIGKDYWVDLTSHSSSCKDSLLNSPDEYSHYQKKIEDEPIKGTFSELIEDPDEYSTSPEVNKKFLVIKLLDGRTVYMKGNKVIDELNLLGYETPNCIYPEEPKIYWEKLKSKKDLQVQKSEKERKIQLSKQGVRLGMTPKQVIEDTSWGKPKSINRTTNEYGVREQWVYGIKNYLYFENGKLTSIQN